MKGQYKKRILNRVDNKFIINEFTELMGYNKRFILTLYGFVAKPHKALAFFLTKNRDIFIKPLKFLVVTCTIYAFLGYFMNETPSEWNTSGFSNSYVIKIIQWIGESHRIRGLSMTFFIGFWIKTFFRKSQYNFYEILVVICYVMGVITLFSGFENIITSYFGSIWMYFLVLLLNLFYFSWFIGEVFGRKIKNYLKAVLVYLLGNITFLLVIVAMGVILDKTT